MMENTARELGLDAAEIAERKRFLDFGEADVVRLRAMDAGVAEARSGFADAFYDYLRSYAPLAALLHDEDAVSRLKAAHDRYFAELTEGEYGFDYVQRRLKVGLVHAQIGLEPKWYVGAFRKYLADMLPALWDQTGGERDRFLAACDSLLKVVVFDLCLTLDTYIHADKRSIALRDRAIESSVNGVFIADASCADYPLIYVNPAFERILGFAPGSALGRACICRDGVPGEVCNGYTDICQAISRGTEGYTVLSLERENGAQQSVELFLAPVENESGDLTHFIGVLNDVTARTRAEKRLIHQASHDALTGLPNRTLLNDRITQAIARSRGRLTAVMFLDLDRFKLVNDSYGHAVGDSLIREVASRVSACLRAGDTVARLGGDEFVVLLEDLASVEDAARLAGKLRDRLSESVRIGTVELPLSASIGVALAPRDGRDPETLLKNADIAMYRAKERGRNNYCFYGPEMDHHARRRLTIESELRHALANGELEVHYQPQVHLATGALTGAEALVRWRHPQRGLLLPGEFIAVAEDTGLIVPLGEQVLRAACRQSTRWREAGRPDLKVAVNLSGRQFRRRDLVEQVCAILAETGASAAQLELEITESVAMADADGSAATLAGLRRQGISLAIDDFGTGYSSLSYLKRFPIDTLKIDRSFIQGIPADGDDTAIVQAIIAMARSLRLSLLAEGIETPAQHEFLLAHGCSSGQGFLFGRAMPAEDFHRLIPCAAIAG